MAFTSCKNACIYSVIINNLKPTSIIIHVLPNLRHYKIQWISSVIHAKDFIHYSIRNLSLHKLNAF